jgi:hypothetical protein
MTAEEKREQILKRALPALFITIIYFIFISDIMGEQAAKAQEDYNNIMRRGISPAALPGVYKQQEQVRSKLATLRTEQAQYLNDIKSMAGFLSGAGDTTDAAAQLANILAEHHLRVARELSESFASANLRNARFNICSRFSSAVITQIATKINCTHPCTLHLLVGFAHRPDGRCALPTLQAYKHCKISQCNIIVGWVERLFAKPTSSVHPLVGFA